MFDMLAYDPAQRPSFAEISKEARRCCLLYDANIVPGLEPQRAPPGEPYFDGTQHGYILSIREYPDVLPRGGYAMPIPPLLVQQQPPLMFPEYTKEKKKAAYRFTKYVG